MSTAPESASGYERDAQGTTRSAVEERSAYRTAQYETYENGSTGATGLAAWLLILGGIWSFFFGLAMVIRKSYFTSLPSYPSAATHYAYHWNLSGWGWANLILGIVVVAAGACVLLGQTWARVTGVLLTVISAIGNFLLLPYFPVWSILVIALDIFIIWALMTARRRQDV